MFTIKKITVCTLCAAMVLSFAACSGENNASSNPSNDSNENVQIANPWKSYDRLEAAQAAAGFSFTLPQSITAVQYSVMQEDSTILQVDCQNFDGVQLTLRKAKTDESDISGVYNDYSQVQTLEIGTRPVTVKGENDLFSLAIWSENGYTYSIYVSSQNGLSQKALEAIVSAVE